MEQEPEHPLTCLWQNAVVNNINARQKKAVLTFDGGKIIYVGKKNQLKILRRTLVRRWGLRQNRIYWVVSVS